VTKCDQVHAAFHPSPSLPPPFPPSTTHHLILYTPSWWLSKNNPNNFQVSDAPAVGGTSKHRTWGGRAPLAAVRHQLAVEGWMSLYAGIGPRLLKVGPSCAIVLGSYELLKGLLNQ
jgi:hypothetical protein